VASVALLAQAQEQTPIFRSAIEAVQIHVYVTDADGNPVSGLTVDDFELVEDGKPQPVTTFEAVNIPIERGDSIEPGLAEPDVLTNDGPPGRAYVFAIDDLDGCAALRTRHFLRQFLDDFFGPDDIAAVALVGRGLATDGQDFTRNRRLLLNAVEKISGEGSQCSASRDPGDARTSGRSQQMASLRDLVESLVSIASRHKAMLFFTHGPAIDMIDIVDYNGGVLGLAGDDAHAAMAAATRSNLRIYPIDPSGLTPGAVSLAAKGAFQSLGEATGGFALVDSNSFTESFERIVRENSTYYMLAFNSAYDKDDGKYVRVQVRVKQPGLTVRAREGYVAPTRQLRQSQERARSVRTATSAVAAALASPLPTSGMPMRVFATPFKGRGKNTAVVLAVELEAASLDLDDRDGVLHGSVDVHYLATDAKRKVYPEVARTASVEIKPDFPGPVPLERIRVRVVSELALPAGRYQLRVAAGTDIFAGNVVYDLEVPDFSDGPLSMSGLMVVAANEPMVLTLNSSSSARTIRSVRCTTPACTAPTVTDTSDVPLAPGVTEPLLRSGTPGSPTTRRDFTAGDELMLVAEVYDNGRRRQRDTPAVITLAARLRDSSGKEIPLASEQRPAMAMRDGILGHAFKVNVTMPEVPEGAYVLRVEARSNADKTRVVSREIPVRVR
jgi:VWFA-related protein